MSVSSRQRRKRLEDENFKKLLDENTEKEVNIFETRKYVPLKEREKKDNEFYSLVDEFLEQDEDIHSKQHLKEVVDETKLIKVIIITGLLILTVVMGVLLLTRG